MRIRKDGLSGSMAAQRLSEVHKQDTQFHFRAQAEVHKLDTQLQVSNSKPIGRILRAIATKPDTRRAKGKAAHVWPIAQQAAPFAVSLADNC